jgi:hypothetical protein
MRRYGREHDDGIIAQWGDGFQAHVAGALHGPFIVLFEEDSADQSGDGSSHNVASFQWNVLLERGYLRAKYGWGFQSGLTGQRQDAPERAQEGAHGPAEAQCGVAGAGGLRGDADCVTVPARGLRTPGADPVPCPPANCTQRKLSSRRGGGGITATQES